MDPLRNTAPKQTVSRSARSIGDGEVQQFGCYGAGRTRILGESSNASRAGLISPASSRNVLRKKGPDSSQSLRSVSASSAQQAIPNTLSYSPSISSPLNPFSDPPSIES